jgi:hypothetical protein
MELTDETRTQQQKQQEKVDKQLEAEKHIDLLSVDHRRNRGGNQ